MANKNNIVKNVVIKKHGQYIVEVKPQAYKVKGSSYADKLKNAVKDFLGSKDLSSLDINGKYIH